LKRLTTYCLWGLITCLFLNACNSTKRLNQNEFLLVKNNIINKNKKILNEELESYLKQKPNRKIFGFWRFHLMLHNWGSGKRDSSKFNRWLRKIGEAPIVLDSFQTHRSKNQLQIYLKNKGYFDGKVFDSVVTKKKKAKVYYRIESGSPYTIRNYTYSADDSILVWIARSADRINPLIFKGKEYDADILDAERAKITREMKMNGYFYFEKDYIRFDADTTIGNRQIDLRCIINNPLVPDSIKPDSLVPGQHKIYRLGNIYINTQFNPKSLDFGSTDTLFYNGFIFTYNKKLKFNPETLMDNIFLQSGKGYQINHIEQTYRRLGDLKTFRFTNIAFAPDPKREKENILNAYLALTPSSKRNISLDMQGTNTSSNLGVSLNFAYQNKNTFRGAEMLEIKALSGFENQIVSSGVDRKIWNLPFNTIEVGGEANLYFPKFILPFSLSRLSQKVSAPKTQLKIQSNLQQRPDFTRNNLRFSYGINFKKGNFHKFYLNIYEINRVNVYDQSQAFTDRLDSINDLAVRFSYQPHFTTSSNFTYQFSNQIVSKQKDFSFFRFYLESAGSTVYGISKLIKAQQDTSGNYLIGGIPFSQFIKAEIDFRHYFIFNSWSQFVVRFNAGLGIPLTNLQTLPYESNFFGGGANGIRAWNFRRLGPGSAEASSLDQFGDTKLEFNAEYRFGIYKFFKGALFADAGNVWFTPWNAIRSPKGTFAFNSFYKQIAVGAGLGLRMDFTFFIIRLDIALKLHNPVKEEGDRWFSDLRYQKDEASPPKFNLWKVPTYQIGIGYPF
jgi:outer membrane translocation and assembly module TamA